MKHSLLVWSLLTLALVACKDEEPCDEGQDSIGTGCFPRASGGSGGSDTPEPSAGESSGGAPAGNPEATFGTPCESNDDCGGDAPVCDNKMFHYCLQIDCQPGEKNAGTCPEGWSCISSEGNPSACITF